MLVQPLVENAIKHGLQNPTAGAKITVSFRMEKGSLVCEVDDNGIGRKASEKNRTEARKHSGLQITRDRLLVLSQIMKTTYAFEVIDKYDQSTNAALGTCVRFVIPFVEVK